VLKVALLTLFLFFTTGCAPKVANTWQERIVKAPEEKIRLHVETYGSGKPVVLLHGFGASSYSFSRIIPALSKHFKLYAIDLKGFGASPRPDDHRYSVYDQAVLVERFLKAHHLDHVTLIGHSYGGGVALSLALMDPARIDKMVLIDAAAYAQQLPKLIRWLQIPVVGPLAFYLLPASYEVEDSYRYAFYDDRKIPEDIVKVYTENLRKPGAKRVYLEASHQLVPEDITCVSRYYRTIRIPTLILWGADDIVIRPSRAYRLHRDLRNSRLRIIPRCGHIPQEECPEAVVRALEKIMLK
jgi:pimeloyl-ACP methyl ester carboxylesterase